MDHEKQARRYFVSGNVQGVGFRLFVLRVAEKLEISGYARNLFDGRVEVLAIGSDSRLSELKAALERGPRFATVAKVLEEPAGTEGHRNGFTIEQDA